MRAKIFERIAQKSQDVKNDFTPVKQCIIDLLVH